MYWKLVLCCVRLSSALSQELSSPVAKNSTLRFLDVDSFWVVIEYTLRHSSGEIISITVKRHANIGVLGHCTDTITSCLRRATANDLQAVVVRYSMSSLWVDTRHETIWTTKSTHYPKVNSLKSGLLYTFWLQIIWHSARFVWILIVQPRASKNYDNRISLVLKDRHGGDLVYVSVADVNWLDCQPTLAQCCPWMRGLLTMIA